MGKSRPSRNEPLQRQRVLAFLMSLALSLAICYTAFMVATTQRWILILTETMNAAASQRRGDITGFYVLFVFAVALLTILLSLVQSRLLQKPLVFWLSGAMVTIAPPMSWIIITQFQWFGEFPFTHVRGSFLFEMAACVLCLLLCVVRKWPVPLPVSLALVALHFAYWVKRFATDELNPVAPWIPIAGLIAMLAWIHSAYQLTRLHRSK